MLVLVVEMILAYLRECLPASLHGCRKRNLLFMSWQLQIVLYLCLLIFFVGLPTQEEREEIVAIQLERKGRKQKNFDVKKIAQSCDGFTGAEIEEAIVSAMFEAYADNARELTSDDIISQMKSCQPASEGIMKDTVEALNEWASKENVRNANSTVCTQNENSAKKTATKKTPGGRVIRRVGGNKE